MIRHTEKLITQPDLLLLHKDGMGDIPQRPSVHGVLFEKVAIYHQGAVKCPLENLRQSKLFMRQMEMGEGPY